MMMYCGLSVGRFAKIKHCNTWITTLRVNTINKTNMTAWKIFLFINRP